MTQDNVIHSSSVPLPEYLLWIVAALLITLLASIRGGAPRLSNDSYQYLSIAEHLAQQHHVATSIIHFDSERSHGRIPAPETTFPPGYSLLLALLNRAGLSLEHAALAVSLTAHVLALLLLLTACKLLALPSSVTRACALLWIVNFYATHYAISILSEAVFTAVIFAATLLLISTHPSSPHPAQRWRLPLACLLFGLAYWVRYAGLLLLPALVAYGLYQAFFLRKHTRLWIISLLMLLAVVAAGMLRNLALTGTWQGGNTKPASHSPLLIAKEFLRLVHQLLFGHLGGTWRWPQLLAASAYLAFLLTSAALLALRFRPGVVPSTWLGPLRLFVLIIATYSAGLFYLGTRSPITIGPRMFYPMLPFLLAAGCILFLSLRARLGSIPRTAYTGLALACLLAVTYMNLSTIYRYRDTPLHLRIEQALDQPIQPGLSARTWLQHNLPQDSVIVAADGQATAYLLQRKTISLVSNEYSTQEWTEPAVQSVMSRFQADYLILYPAAEPVAESPFLTRLLNGQPPPWLNIVAQNPRLRVFRRQF